MGDKITQLPVATTVDGTEIVPIVQGGATKQVTGAILRSPVGTAGGDLAGTYPNPTLAAITTAQTVGSVSQIPVVTVDAKGRVASISTAANPQGTVTSVVGGTGLTGGTITSTGTLAVSYGTTAGTAAQGNDARLSNSRAPSGAAGGDLAGTYPNPTLAAVTTAQSNIGSSTQVPVISVDAKGRVTALSSVAVSTSSGITALTGDVTATGPGSVAGTLASITTAQTNIGSGTTVPVISVDAKGRVTALSSTPISGSAGGTVTSITAGTGLTGGTITSSGTIALSTVAVNLGGTGQTSYTDGQLLIGNSTGNTLAKTTLTAGSNVTITNGPGTITIASTGNTYTANYLIVAGGGGANTGGGGAGGMRTGAVSLAQGTTYTVVVGAGGAGSATTSNAVSGSDSSIVSTSTLTSLGGGRSGTYVFPGNGTVGIGGGSGGGAGANGSITSSVVLGGAGTVGQGNNGGSTPGISGSPTGGGGGAGANGANGTGTKGGDGGIGLQSSITGTAVYYAGGGGGIIASGGLGSGGLGGGGNGAVGNNPGVAGTVNTGGGGGGGGATNVTGGGAGGSGIVILSVPTANYTGTITGSPTVTTSGANTIISFASSGSYTA